MSSVNRFFTRSAANEGRILQLTEPDGTPSTDWIRVAGVDSDAYEIAVASERNGFASDDVEQIREKTKKLYAKLILEWSFADLPCTLENAVMLLTEAPQIRRQLINFVNDEKSFFSARQVP